MIGNQATTKCLADADVLTDLVPGHAGFLALHELGADHHFVICRDDPATRRFRSYPGVDVWPLRLVRYPRAVLADTWPNELGRSSRSEEGSLAASRFACSWLCTSSVGCMSGTVEVVMRGKGDVVEAVVVRRGALLTLWSGLLLARLLSCCRGLRVRALLALLWLPAKQLHRALHIHDDLLGVALDAVLLQLIRT